MKQKHVNYIIIIIIMGIIPFVLIYGGFIDPFIGRIISYNLFFLDFLVISFWLAVNKKIPTIKSGGKAHHFKNRKVWELSGRIFLFISFIIGAWVYKSLFIDDINLICNNKYEVIEGRISNIGSTYRGLWFLKQTIEIEGHKSKYIILFVNEKLRINKVYKFITLPESKMIVKWDKN